MGCDKNKLKIKFHSEHVYEYKYLKTKVRESDRVIKTIFLGNGIPTENYTCIILALPALLLILL